jgi:hypothetical protein
MTPLEQQFIENPLFLRWVYHNNPVVEKYWEQYLDEHPLEKEDALAFKGRLRELKFSDDILDPEEKSQISANILSQINREMQRKSRLTIVRSLLRYAAVAIFFFCIGGLQVYLFMNKHNQIPQFASESFKVPSSSKGPTLITSKGESVDLQRSSSTLDYTRNGEIVLNEDSIMASSPDQANQLNQLVIPYGNQSKIVLSDNTVVWLNAGSRLFYPTSFKNKTREVTLFGEAYFEVSKNPEMPFIVKTSTMDIKVLGTIFNVSAYTEDNVVQTVLKEGSVSIRRKDAGFFENDIVIKPNQMATFNKTTSDTKIYEVDAEYYTLWTKGLISFEEIDFKRIIQKIERFYNIKVDFSDLNKEAIRISGKLDLKRSRKEVMEYLEKVSLSKFVQVNENLYVIE